jgi:hypothetical protein
MSGALSSIVRFFSPDFAQKTGLALFFSFLGLTKFEESYELIIDQVVGFLVVEPTHRVQVLHLA